MIKHYFPKNVFLQIVCIFLILLIYNICYAGNSIVFYSESGLTLDIKFNFDSWVIKEESFVYLGNLSTEMKSQEWNNHNFVIEGHTDSQGSSEYNQRLSQNRANVVKNYLVKQGIHQNRLIVRTDCSIILVQNKHTV